MKDEILEEIRQVSKEYPDGIHKRTEAQDMFKNGNVLVYMNVDELLQILNKEQT